MIDSEKYHDVIVRRIEAPYIEDDEIDLLDLLIVLAKNKWRILLVTVLFCFAGVFFAFREPHKYQSSVEFVSRGEVFQGIAQQLDSSLLERVVPSSKAIVDLFKTRVVVDAIIEKNNLVEHYASKGKEQEEVPMDSLRKTVLGNFIASLNANTGMLTFSVTDTDARDAAEFANESVAVMEHFLQQRVAQAISQQRILWSKEVELLEKKAQGAEKDLAKYREAAGLSGEAFLEKLRRLESQETGGSFSLLVQQLPDGGMEYSRLEEIYRKNQENLRDLKDKLESLQNIASRNPKIIQVFSPALPSEISLKSNRRLKVLLGGVLGFFLGVFWAFLKEFFHNAAQDPERAKKVAQLSQLIRIWRNSSNV